VPFSLRSRGLNYGLEKLIFNSFRGLIYPNFFSGHPVGVVPTFFLKMLARKLFQKKLKQKPLATFGFGNLIPKPYRRDKPAQRFRVNSFEQTLLVKFI